MNLYDRMQKNIRDTAPEIRGWYQGYSDAAFWSSGHQFGRDNHEVIDLPAPDEIYVQDATGHIQSVFDPGLLWDLIIWGDDGRISLFRIKPDDNPQSVIIQFSTTEGDTPPDWTTPERDDFIAEYNRQKQIVDTRDAYIPGSGK